MKSKKQKLVEVELDVSLDTLSKIQKLVEDGKYSSVENAIVSILTDCVKNKKELDKKKKPKQPVGPKKMPNPTKRPSVKPPQRMPQRRGR
jgi:hypothetical protein